MTPGFALGTGTVSGNSNDRLNLTSGTIGEASFERIVHGSSASGRVNADLTTGTFKFGVDATAAAQQQAAKGGLRIGLAEAYANFSFSETITAQGDGTLNSSLAIDGAVTSTDLSTVSLTGLFADIGSGAEASMRVTSVSGSPLNLSDSFMAPGRQVVDEVLELSFNVLDGDQFTLEIFGHVEATIFSDQGVELNASADFFNTAVLGLSTTEGLSVVASNPDVLSNVGPAFGQEAPPAIPLPGSAPLLLAGLGLLAYRRHRAASPIN